MAGKRTINLRPLSTIPEKDRLDKDRKITDFVFIFVAVFYFSVFFVAINYAFSEPINKYDEVTHLSVVPRINKTLRIFREFYFQDRRTLVLVPCVILNGVLLLCLLIVFRFHPQYCSQAGKIVTLAGIIFSSIITIAQLISLFSHVSFNFLIYPLKYLFLFFVLCIMFYGCIIKTGINAPASVIQKSLQALFFHRSLIVFSLTITFVELIILIVGSGAFTRAYIQKNYLLVTVIFLSSYYIVDLILHFARMVISQSIAVWYRTRNKKNISDYIVFQCIGTVSRFHLGTLALGTSKVMSVCLSAYAVKKHKIRDAQESDNSFLKTICKIYLILFASDYVLISTSANGYDFVQASKKTLPLVIKNYHLALATDWIFQAFLSFGLLLSIFISTELTVLVCNYKNSFDAILDINSIIVLYLLVDLVRAPLNVVLLETFEGVDFVDELEDN